MNWCHFINFWGQVLNWCQLIKFWGHVLNWCQLIKFWGHVLNWCQLINIWGHVLLIVWRTNVEVERLGGGDLVVVVDLAVVVDLLVVGDLVVVDDTLCCLPLKGSVGGVRGLLVDRVGRTGAVFDVGKVKS